VSRDQEVEIDRLRAVVEYESRRAAGVEAERDALRAAVREVQRKYSMRGSTLSDALTDALEGRTP
jgi:hypothetical protein